MKHKPFNNPILTNPPAVFTKFLFSKDIDRVLIDETVVISSNHYFRDEYHREALRWIGDPREGITLHLTDKTFDSAHATPQEWEVVRRLPIGPFRGNVLIDNSMIASVLPEFYMLCGAVGPWNDLVDAFCHNFSEILNPYDAFYEIADFSEFTRLLLEGVVLTPLNMGDPLCFGDLFSGAECGYVRYCNKEVGWSKGYRSPSPFEKDWCFLPQLEYRMVFRSEKKLPNRLIVKVPGLGKVVARSGVIGVRGHT